MATPSRDLAEWEIEQVWQKAKIIPNNDPNIFRQDYAGAWIRRDKYGDRTSEYGWEADHLIPLAQNGEYTIANMYPLQWQNNAEKSDNYPRWQTKMSAEGVHNVEQIRNWYVTD